MSQENDYLRDVFAGLAMQAILANSKLEKQHPDSDSIAQDAYLLANAMMKARTE